MSAQAPGPGQDMAAPPPSRPPTGYQQQQPPTQPQPQPQPQPQQQQRAQPPPPGVQVSGPPRQFVPGGAVGPPPPRSPLPPRPSGPNSFAPQQQQLQQRPPPQQVPQPQQQPPPRRQAPPPQQFQQQSSFDKQSFPQRPPAPLLSPASRQSSVANLIPPDTNGQIRRPQMEPDAAAVAAAKNRSYSIAGTPAVGLTPQEEERRRQSVAGIGMRPNEEPVSRGPGLAFIKENEVKESPLNVGLTRLSKEDLTRGSRESVRSDSSDGKGGERPESRLSGSRMTESIIGSLDGDERKQGSPKIRPRNVDDDDDVIMHNNRQPVIQNGSSPSPNKTLPQENGYKATNVSASPPLLDRSPSLTKSDSSPDQSSQRANVMMTNRPPSAQAKAPEMVAKPPTPVAQNREPVRPPSAQSSNRVNTPDIKGEDMRNRTPDPVTGRPPSRAGPKPTNFEMPIKTAQEDRKPPPTHRKAVSAPRTRREGDNDSGVDESTQGNEHVNGSPGSPGKKSPTKIPGLKGPNAASVGKPGVMRSPSKSAAPHTPNTPDSTTSNTSIEKKKMPMNKVQVGSAPSPNIKAVRSKIGSLENATHKPGGGHIKIENRKLDFNKVTPRIAAKNDTYTPGGGDKKITQKKLQWNAKSKIGSLENATHKPGGGDKKIETVKLDFKDKAKPKVASTVNMNHKPGGGDVKFVKWPLRRWRASYKHTPIRSSWEIENQKVEVKAQSKIGSLDNVKHRPGGGDVKIFDDKNYLKQISANAHDNVITPPSESPVPPVNQPTSDVNLNQKS